MRLFAALIVGCAILAMPVSVRAGLYHPDVLAAFDLDQDGNIIPLTADAFLVILNIAKEADWNDQRLTEEIARTWLEIMGISPHTQRTKPQRYLQLLSAIDARKAKGLRNLTAEEKFAQSADLLRLRFNGKALDDALTLLSNLSRRPPEGFEFLILAHYSHALLLKGEFGSAFENADSAIKDYPFPEKLYNLKPGQLAWYRHFERAYHLPFLRQRKEEARLKNVSAEHLGIDPLFPARSNGESMPVRYVGESGKFVPGSIADSERAKLPPDALAVLQQLVLWYPSDDRLIWQLAEFYNAEGDLRTAAKLFDICVKELKPRSQEVRDHRSLVLEALENAQAREAVDREEMKLFLEQRKAADEAKKAADEARAKQADEDKKQRENWIRVIVAVLLVVIVYWQSREVLRRYRARK